MTAVFRLALGDDFDRLHPMMQRRFGVGLEEGAGCIGRGVMSQVRVGAPWVRLFLGLGALRNVLVPRSGRDVPFEIHNFPYRDPLGRETVTFVRRFHFPGARSDAPARFDATMIWGGTSVIDYLGTHQHLATDLRPRVTDEGGLVMTSGEQRFYAGPLGFTFPSFLTGRAIVRERFDDDSGRFEITVAVHHSLFGLLEGYRGTFACEFVEAHDAPAELKPAHHEVRR